MNLSDIDIQLAERSAPQAVNLGFVTARRYFPQLFLAAVLASLPWLLLAGLVGYYYAAWLWAPLILWWGKPYIDRVILLNASRLLFREPVTLNDILASLGAAMRNGLWLNLTFYRLSPARCVTLPIRVLEGVQGRDYSTRRKVVLRASRSSTAVTVGLAHFDAFLYFSVVLLIVMFLPDSMNPFSGHGLQRILSGEETLNWLNGLLLPIQALCSALIEVFYVMVGFMMYLNSRIKTEGWHIDIGFKQIAERLTGVRRVALSLLMFVGALTLLPLSIERAQASQLSVELTPEVDRQIMRDMLLENKPFEVTGSWEANDKPETKPKDKDWDKPNFSGFSGFAPVLKIVLILCGLAVLFWVITQRERFLGWFSAEPVVKDERPNVLFGLDIRRESLPDDIAGHANRLFEKGNLHGALSLLYRGSLVALVHDYALDIKDSDTEGDCLHGARSRVQASTFAYFKTLTQTWQAVVYAHRHPDNGAIRQLIAGYNGAFRAGHNGAMGDEVAL